MMKSQRSDDGGNQHVAVLALYLMLPQAGAGLAIMFSDTLSWMQEMFRYNWRL